MKTLEQVLRDAVTAKTSADFSLFGFFFSVVYCIFLCREKENRVRPPTHTHTHLIKSWILEEANSCVN